MDIIMESIIIQQPIQQDHGRSGWMMGEVILLRQKVEGGELDLRKQPHALAATLVRQSRQAGFFHNSNRTEVILMSQAMAIEGATAAVASGTEARAS